MYWMLSNPSDPEVRPLADRHYNRQKIGASGFTPPGRKLVLKTKCRMAYWITSWPFTEYVKHEWAGAFVCTAFRNETKHLLSSELITQALQCTLWKYPNIPELGMITFVNLEKVRPKQHPGYCFRMAGFEHVGYTKGGLLALQLKPDKFPRYEKPLGTMF